MSQFTKIIKRTIYRLILFLQRAELCHERPQWPSEMTPGYRERRGRLNDDGIFAKNETWHQSDHYKYHLHLHTARPGHLKHMTTKYEAVFNVNT